MHEKPLKNRERKVNSRMRRHRFKALMLCLSLLVAAGTLYILSQPAETMEKTLICVLEEHIHANTCFLQVPICDDTEPEHIHDEACCIMQLCCERAEHEHTEECYAVQGAGMVKQLESGLPQLSEQTLYSPLYTYEDGEECLDGAAVYVRALVPEGAYLHAHCVDFGGLIVPEGEIAVCAITLGIYQPDGTQWQAEAGMTVDLLLPGLEPLQELLVYGIEYDSLSSDLQAALDENALSFTSETVSSFAVTRRVLPEPGIVLAEEGAAATKWHDGSVWDVEYYTLPETSINEIDKSIMYSQSTLQNLLMADRVTPEGGNYSISYILNNYNHFVETDSKAPSHTVGAIAVGADASYGALGGATSGGRSQNETPSYIKGLLNGPDITSIEKSVNTLFLGKVNLTNKNAVSENAYYKRVQLRETILDGVFFSDDYINFAAAFAAIQNEANAIASMPSIEVSLDETENDYYSIEYSWPGVNLFIKKTAAFDLTGIISQLDCINISAISGNQQSDALFISHDADISLPAVFGTGVSGEASSGLGLAFVFPEASSVEYNKAYNPHYGHIVAPNAHISIDSGDINGSFIAKSLFTSGESHMHPYNGTVIEPQEIRFKACKTVDNASPAEGESFSFTLAAWDAQSQAWLTLETAENNGSAISFKNIFVDLPTDGSSDIYYYKISENTGADSSYTYDKNVYLVKVEVSAIMKYSYYLAEPSAGYYALESQADIDAAVEANVQRGTAAFNNTRSFDYEDKYCSITAQKLWQNAQGDAVEGPDKISLSFKLYRQRGTIVLGSVDINDENFEQYIAWEKNAEGGDYYQLMDGAAGLADKDGGWSYTWTDLLRARLEGDEIAFYRYLVEEPAMNGYTTSYQSGASAAVSGFDGLEGLSGGTVSIINKAVSTDFELPATGGSGIRQHLFFGALLLLISCLGAMKYFNTRARKEK